MRNRITVAAAVIFGVVLFAAGIEAQQRGWIMPLKSAAVPATGARSGVLRARPLASIGGDANGLYCVAPTENGIGIHDIGALPAGVHVVVTVEGFSDGFNPVAAVMVSMLGQKAANTLKVTNFYDNDSGGEGDAKVDFVTPQDGNYMLLVGDFTDTVPGCYRYQVLIG